MPPFPSRYATILRMNGVNKQGELNGTKKRFIPVLILLLIIAIVVGVFFFYRNYPEQVSELKNYGYPGIFLISLILNATIIFPVGNVIVIATLGAALPSAPLVGLIGGAGAAIGEMTGYMAGYSGRTIVSRQKTYIRLERWVKKWGVLAVFVLSVVPFFFDLAGIAAGALRLPVWKFWIACWLGRTILYIIIARVGTLGWEAILPHLNF